jgi:GNAT superfamily N-acetyltransferase
MIHEYPLTKANRIRLARAFRNVPRVDISITCVLENQMGAAFVDDIENPSAFMVRIGPFHYFAGDPSGNGSAKLVKGFEPYNLFMSASKGWAEAFQEVFGERFFAIERYIFSSENLSLDRVTKLSQASPYANEVKRMGAALIENLKGKDNFIDVSDFESSSDFEDRGIGFFIEQGGKVIGAAYSSLVCSMGIEVSLFVEEDYRRKGAATVLSANLLRWCLEHNMDAHWDAANLESCGLAEKLGYTPAGKYTAYFLKPAKSKTS